jgi:hypothetical protein
MNPAATRPQRSGLALASMILGICGIVLCLGPLTGIPAVICGHMAQSKIKQSGGVIGGGGMAVAGLITGYISFLWIVVTLMLAAIAIPNFIKAKQKAEQNLCVNNLKSIQGAKEQWAIEEKKPRATVPTEADLFGPSKYIAQLPVCRAGGTYTLNSVKESPTCSIHGSIEVHSVEER